MSALPSVPYLKGICTEDSDLQKIACIGPFYADQIKNACGNNTLGHFLAYCSNRDTAELVRVLQVCSRNMRAGEPNDKGKAIPVVNVRVLASLLQLLGLGRKQPQLFPHYQVAIKVSSTELNNLLQNLLGV
jgi:hypothetical protein